MSAGFPPVVSTQWLASQLGRPELRVLDGSWYLPGSGRDAASEYAAAHIPGAVFFDLDASSDQTSPLPHMLPRAPAFEERMSQLGVSNSDDVIVYDGSAVNLSAPRVWWMLRTFGHARVAVLDGGMRKWSREHRPTERGIVTPERGRYRARLNSQAVRSLAEVRANIGTGAEQLVDTRSAGRFAGVEPEPRSGLRGGHVPQSLNLPFHELVEPDGTVLPPDQLRQRLIDAGVDLSLPVVATCGSGTSACALVLALDLLGHQEVSLYDGAWAEWGGRPDMPIKTALGPT